MKEAKITKFSKELQSLVRIPSVSGHETVAQKHLLGQFTDFGSALSNKGGFNAFLQSVEGYDAPNMVAHMKGNDGQGSKKALILTGHIDTVRPAGEYPEWQKNNPWSGEIIAEGDSHKIYGLGVSDMKMGLKVLQHVFQELAVQKDLDCDVWFVSCINEELNGAGTEAFAKWFKDEGWIEKYPQGIAAIFGEPRNLGSKATTIGIGNKANDFLIAEKTVGSHHSSEKGANVITDIAELTQGLDALNLSWESSQFESGFTPPYITPTKVETPNENLNSTPAGGSVKLDLRSTPATQNTSLEEVIVLASSLGFSVKHLENPAPGAYTDPESPIVKAFQNVLMQEGVEVDLQTSVGSTDAGFLQAIGIKETVMAGAGTEEVEHHVNEYATLEEGERAIGLTVQACLQWIQMQNNTNQV